MKAKFEFTEDDVGRALSFYVLHFEEAKTHTLPGGTRVWLHYQQVLEGQPIVTATVTVEQ